MGKLLQSTCLKPKYSLRRQLLITFGSIAFLTISITIVLSAITAQLAGRIVQDQGRESLQLQVINEIQSTSAYLADVISRRFANLDGAVLIQHEIVRDRIIGYPYQGWENDTHVPFRDMKTQRNVYPISSSPLPRDWSANGESNLSGVPEHLRDGVFDTSTAMYRFQGNCDPEKTAPTDRAYYAACSSANNDVNTGGVVWPVYSNQYIAGKAADIGALLKPLWESHTEIIRLQVGFHNSGAGSELCYPSQLIDGTVSYVSQGCEWMSQTNSLTGKPFASQVEIERCHPKGLVVNEREYNPMEQEWCIDQALNPGKVRSFGPYYSGSSRIWLMVVGQAVFDRITGEFIACTAAHVELSALKETLDTGSLNAFTEGALVKLDGTVVVSESKLWDVLQATKSVNIVETGFLPQDTFEQFVAFWDFDSEWTPNEVSGHLQKNAVLKGDEVYASLPIPLPPRDYDPSYRPNYFLLLNVGQDIFSSINDVDERVGEDVQRVIVVSVFIGISGLCLVMFVIWSVARVLTMPLNWMESVAWRIVNHHDERAGDYLRLMDEDENTLKFVKCTPKTEISDLVSEFRTMIKGFSGQGSSTVAQKSLSEVHNEIGWRSEFNQLYSRLKSRTVKSNKDEEGHTDASTVSSTNSAEENGEKPTYLSVSMEGYPTSSKATSNLLNEAPPLELASIITVPAPPRPNMGRNSASLLDRRDQERLLNAEFQNELDKQPTEAWRSNLFRWIAILIVLPLLLTILGIGVLVAYTILEVLPSWLETLEAASYEIEIGALVNTASLRASFSQAVMMEPLRDLHLFSRVIGWMLFGGLKLADSVTSIQAGTEECKHWEFGECPILNDNRLSPCDCEWRDPRPLQCWNYVNDTRRLQRGFFCGQSSDIDPKSGDRYKVSYPLHSKTPNETMWWTNVFDLPGAERGTPPFGGYETAFDRVVASSAITVVSIPLYNYIENLGRSKHFLGAYIAFQNDGMITGYSGCSFEHREMAKFQSTVENKAHVYGSGLCPVGKWGYDPRCRGWYSRGLAHAKQGGAVHITAPYLFATGVDVATSATSAIFDPSTDQHVGQAALDFTPEGLFGNLVNTNVEISVVISPVSDASGGNTVIGPSYDAGSNPAPVGEVVLPYDASNSSNRLEFDSKIVEAMKSGGSGHEKFKRTSAEAGGTPLTYVMAYAPIKLRALKIPSPDDYAESVTNFTEFVFSLGVARLDDDLRKPFTEIQDDVNEHHKKLLLVYSCLLVVLSVFVLVLTSLISVSITKPLILLLQIVTNVNTGRIEDDIPPMTGGSTEVNQVYSSFAKLFKIVLVSNTAFFSGNLKWAYHFVNNALQLFRKVGDRKAIGIACNNLANTMLAIYCERGRPHDCCRIDGVCLAKRGEELLDEAILIGAQDMDSAQNDEEKAEFAQQLANRHFNRAIFLLATQEDPCATSNSRESAYVDISEARQHDVDVVDYWLQQKLMLKNSGEYFERLIRRLRGLVDLSPDKGVTDAWDVRELVEDLDRLLFAAWDQPNAPLFRDLNRIGRLQQLEDVVIRLEMSTSNFVEAAGLAIRMLVEDEYVLESSFLSAANALLAYMKLEQSRLWSSQTVSAAKADLRKILKNCKGLSFDAGKCLVLCVELSEVWKESRTLKVISSSCMMLYDEYFSDDDYATAIAFGENVEESLTLDLIRKCKQNRAQIEAATKATYDAAPSTAIPAAVQMLADTTECRDNDTFVIAVVDRSSQGSFSPESMRRHIEAMNRERNTVINFVVIGLNLSAGDKVDGYKELCMVSKASKFFEATEETIESVFDQVSSLITKQSSISGSMLGGITMEKF